MPGYISEINIYGGSPEFIELAIPAGTDTSGYSVVVYNGAGAIRQTLSLDPSVTTIAGDDVYLLNPADDGLLNLDHTDAVALVDDTGTVLQFISWNGHTVSPSTGPAAGLTSTDIGTSSFGESYETIDDGVTYYTHANENPGTIPCFARGTGILTPQGERRIETLSVGDEVVTAAGAVRPVRWVQCRVISFADTPQAQRPILIAAGALGPGRPARDLVVSAQHRIAVGAFGQIETLVSGPALVPAKSLTALKGVRVMRGKRQVAWHHLALDTHDLLVAEGCVAETLFFGPMVLHSLTRREILELRGTMPHRVGAESGSPDAPALAFVPAGLGARMIAKALATGPSAGTTRQRSSPGSAHLALT